MIIGLAYVAQSQRVQFKAKLKRFNVNLLVLSNPNRMTYPLRTFAVIDSCDIEHVDRHDFFHLKIHCLSAFRCNENALTNIQR